MVAHRAASIRDAIEAGGAELMFLAPYSPEFNSIGNVFAKLKALMRAKTKQIILALGSAAGFLIEDFSPAECENDLKAAEYEPD